MSRVTAPPAVLFTETISTDVNVGAYEPAVLVIIEIVSVPVPPLMLSTELNVCVPLEFSPASKVSAPVVPVRVSDPDVKTKDTGFASAS